MSRSWVCDGTATEGNCESGITLVGRSTKEIRSVLRELRFEDLLEDVKEVPRDCWTC